MRRKKACDELIFQDCRDRDWTVSKQGAMDRDGGQAADDGADARSALARIVTSEAFRSAPQLAAFLTFVVEKALAGEAHEVKGYTIATQALGRGTDFDPQLDPIVRVEAGRLRRALDAYYANAGRDDRLRITIPRGSYVPAFERAPEPEAVEDSPGPLPWPEEVGSPAVLPPETFDPGGAAPAAVAVSPEIPLAPAPEPVLDTGRETAVDVRFHRRGWHVAAALVLLLALASALAWWTGKAGGSGSAASRLRPPPAAPAPARTSAEADGRPVVVVQPAEVPGPPPAGFSPDLLRGTVLDALARFDEVAVVDAARVSAEAGAPGRERYVLNLRVAAGPSVMARLTHEGSGQVVWARRFDAASRTDPAEPPETDVARQVATSVGQPYGVLYADLMNRPGLTPRLRCTLLAYEYWNNPAVQRHAEARACLESVVAAEPRAATVHANLAYFYLDEHRASYNPRPEPLERALQSARRALALAPDSPRANQALMGVHFTRGDVEQALRYGQRALELNPFDADVLADVGARYVQTGRYADGAGLIARAAAINPADPPWYDFFLFLAAYMQEDREGARAAAQRITSDDYVLGLVARAIVAAEGGDIPRARDLVTRLKALQPEYGHDPRAALKRRWFVPEIYDRLVTGLESAGIRS